MWRNLRIRFKLLIGFGLLLVVFLLSVITVWRDVTYVQEISHFLSTALVDSMKASSELERALNETFMAVRLMQFTESEESIAEVKKLLVTVQKDMDEMIALGRVYPSLDLPKIVQENLLPSFKAYVALIDATISDIQIKQMRYSKALKAGETMADATAQITETIHTLTENDVRNNASPEQILSRLHLIKIGESITLDVTNLRRGIQTAISTRNTEAIKTALALINILEKDVAILRPFADTPQKTQVLNQLNAAMEEYTNNLELFIQSLVDLEDANRQRLSLYKVVNENTIQSAIMAQNRMKALAEETVKNLNESVFLLLGSAIVSIILGILIAIFISRSISKPLNTIVTVASRAGHGDLTIEKEDFHYTGKDEMGVLVNALADMIKSQEEVFQQVVNVANNLTNSAGNLSFISEKTNASMGEVKISIDQVSTLSESNSAALEECNAGVEEMSAGADTVARSATDSAAFIAQTTGVSNKAIHTVDSVIVGMHKVNENAKEAENKTKQLVTSVGNVGSFVSVITGIADQTNLLALNAAIEAARAGEVGRGFAVVAEEVRKLAEESARAAQNVNGIIVELQNSAQENIKATIEAGRMLLETLDQAGQAQTDLNSALKEMNKANDSIQNIAAVAEEQAASSKEVTLAIDGATKSTMNVAETLATIRRATDETVQAAQSVAEQSRSVNEHAEMLTEVLSRFTLRNASTPVKGQKALRARK